MRTWNVKRRTVAALSAVAIATGGLIAVTTGPAAAAGESCWESANSSPYKNVYGQTLFRGNYTVRWCGQDGRVTKFWVLRCDVSDVNSLIVQVPAQSSDCQPRTGNGGTSLPIYGDMWGNPTLSYDDGISYKPGSYRIHFEITLYPNGVITGTTGG
jgi:hypothetical protein